MWVGTGFTLRDAVNCRSFEVFILTHGIHPCVTPEHSYVDSAVSGCQHRAAMNTGTFRAACLELHSGQKIFGKTHLSVVSYIRKVIKKDQLGVLLPLSNKYTNRNKVLRMHIYVIGKWKLKDLRDFSVRKDMLAAGVALRLPAYILPLR